MENKKSIEIINIEYYYSMGRYRLSNDDYKQKVTIRLKGSVIKKIEQMGTKQDIIEKAVDEFLDKKGKT